MNLPKSENTTLKQEKQIKATYKGEDYCLTISWSYHSANKNRHFSMTYNSRNSSGYSAETISTVFPEYAKYLKWHLVSSDGPMHYMGNSMYFAGNRDYDGLLKGERKVISEAHYLYANNVPKFLYKFTNRHTNDLGVIGDLLFDPRRKTKTIRTFEIFHTPSYDPTKTLSRFSLAPDTEWVNAYFEDEESIDMCIKVLQTCDTIELRNEPDIVRIGKGKEPDLQAARDSAVWPEAELEDFTEEKLKARLPALMEEFKKDIIELGFEY